MNVPDQVTGALGGYRVLDFSQAWAGPVASMMLGDLGASIAKVEPPVIGDHVRKWTRPDLGNKSPYYLAANRNKRSIGIDLKNRDGLDLALSLAAEADVVLENFRPGTMEKLGLGYDTVSRANPKIVYCSVSGYGHTGPYAQRAAYDLLVQGEAGLISVTGQQDGSLAKIGVPIADVMSGNIAAFSILAALLARQTTGKGQRLDISMMEVASMTMGSMLVDYALSGTRAKPLGTANQLLAPYQVYATGTTPIVIGVLSEGHWKEFCNAVQRPDLLGDERFIVAGLRTINRDALNEQLSVELAKHPAVHWIEVLGNVGIACGHVNDVDGLLAHPQHEARRFFLEFDEGGEPYTVPGIPWRVAPELPRSAPPPGLGEHTSAILAEWLSMTAPEIKELSKRRAVFGSGCEADDDR